MLTAVGRQPNIQISRESHVRALGVAEPGLGSVEKRWRVLAVLAWWPEG